MKKLLASASSLDELESEIRRLLGYKHYIIDRNTNKLFNTKTHQYYDDYLIIQKENAWFAYVI